MGSLYSLSHLCTSFDLQPGCRPPGPYSGLPAAALLSLLDTAESLVPSTLTAVESVSLASNWQFYINKFQ